MSVENLDREQIEKEFYPFLNPSAKPAVKHTATEYFLGLTGTEEGKKFIGGSKKFLTGIISLTEDDGNDIVEKAFKTLINLTTIQSICVEVAGLENISEFLSKTLQKVLDPTYINADFACKFLSNFTRSEMCASKVATVVLRNPDTMGVVKIVTTLSNLKFNSKANLHYLAPVLANLTQIKLVRDKVLAKDQLVVQKLLSFIQFQDSRIRRHGVVCCLRNCCFETKQHDWLMGDSVDILPRLLLPLAGGEEFDDDDMEKLPDDLQYLPPDKEREKDPEIRKMLVEALFRLCATPKCRKIMKDKNVYVILREYHKWEPEKSNDTAIMNLIDLMIQDEPEPGMENLHEVEVPEDLQEKFRRQDMAENEECDENT